ncbi:HlyD family secretion protein [Hyphomonas jannaschiana]|jgi:membrane fusion protein (multidrug efflux system)|uniref:Secretion protein HlyD n=1 Tax=Hyphomonas jannaschiana VP2 TaxID=1280952 RepID=A0A059FKR1_9PROT|nr:HlyD family secretion protein [Hyphomonas jannaschiana]KCZ91028.1 secretion protein HlyD [Hyphomonas jannaschiana VP2]
MAVQPLQRDSSQPAAVPAPAAAPNKAEAPARAPAKDAPPAQDPAPQGQGEGLVARFKADPRKYILSGAGLLLALFAGYQGIHWLVAGRYEITTDNAYIRADIATIAPKVQGYVEHVHVTDNQAVKAGDLLVTLEVADYATRVSEAAAALQQSIAAQAQARAGVAAAEANVETATAQIAAQRDRLVQAKASAAAAEADATLAANDLERYTELAGKGHYPKASLDAAATKAQAARASLDQSKAGITTAQSELSVAEANYHRAQEDLASAKAAVAGADAQVEAAQARVDAAKLDATRTELRAPFDGVVANRVVAEGQLLSPGQQTMSIVPVSDAYIVANFKETQVERMRAGQEVDIHVDAYPDLKVTGTLDSIAPATGGQFSLIPMDTATGNFTKIVQRVPVRVKISDEALATGLMRPGLSVEATVIAKGVDG